MKIFCGTDIIEIDRIKKSIESKKDLFLNTIYTKKEIEYCMNRGNARYQHFAARFAAKEAIFKAISDTLEDKYDITWTDVEVLDDEKGRPRVHFIKDKFAKGYKIDISISHCKEYAVATAVAHV